MLFYFALIRRRAIFNWKWLEWMSARRLRQAVRPNYLIIFQHLAQWHQCKFAQKYIKFAKVCLKFCQIINRVLKIFPRLKILPKWRHFAKSGHAELPSQARRHSLFPPFNEKTFFLSSWNNSLFLSLSLSLSLCLCVSSRCELKISDFKHFFFKKIGQSRPLFVYFRLFHISQFNKLMEV